MVELHGVGKGATKVLVVVDVAAGSVVVTDSNLVGSLGESGILQDGEEAVAAASLRLVTVAGKVALGVISLFTIDDVAAVADSVVGETSIAESIACVVLVSGSVQFSGTATMTYPCRWQCTSQQSCPCWKPWSA